MGSVSAMRSAALPISSARGIHQCKVQDQDGNVYFPFCPLNTVSRQSQKSVSCSHRLPHPTARVLRSSFLADTTCLASTANGLCHRQLGKLANERKPLRRGLGIACKAADVGLQGTSSKDPPPFGAIPDSEMEGASKKLKIGIYFVSWWALNVVFNIYNKQVLNVYNVPWLASTLCLSAGATIMGGLWLTGIVEKPETDAQFWWSLLPVAIAHTIGHVAATVSMAKVAVSFTHIIKSAEPAISCLVLTLMGEKYALPVYLSIIPIIFGCSLTAATELNFNMTGFAGAMISNFAFVFRNIFSKKGMNASKNMGGLNYYACLSILSLFLLTPVAFIVEGPKLWATGFETAKMAVGTKTLITWMLGQAVFYHLYNQVSYMSLNEISPLTFSIGNTMKRVSVIVAAIIVFKTKVLPINAIGAAIAVLGTFLYSQAVEYTKKQNKLKAA